jgi:hypothetical protein
MLAGTPIIGYRDNARVIAEKVTAAFSLQDWPRKKNAGFLAPAGRRLAGEGVYWE